MRRINFVFVFTTLALVASAQTQPLNKRYQAAISRAKQTLVSTFDRGLPRVSLEYFLQSEGEGAPIQWEVNDCGEQTGNPAIDRGRDIPTCVEATMTTRDRITVNVSVSVGTVKKGLSGTPAIFSVVLEDAKGPRSVRLGDLPMELHRQPPQRKSPRDSPGVVSA